MTRNTHPLLKSAVLSVLATGVLSTAALAQYRVDNSGARDANNRVGSNGQNVMDTRLNPWQISNAIVNGNISGGKAFRGNVQTGDSFAFRGNSTADRASDKFIRDSSGVSTNGTVSNNASSTTLYYGSSRAAPPPPNIANSLQLQQNANGSYSPPSPVSWTSADPRQQSLSASPINVLQPSDTVGPGPVDMTFTPYGRGGANALSALQSQSQATLSDYTNIGQDVTSNQLTASQLSKMRSAISGQPGEGGQPNAAPGQINNGVPTAQPTNGALNNGGISDNVNPTPLSNNLTAAPGQELGMTSKIASPTGDDNSSPYTQLTQRRGEQEQAARPGQAAEQSAQDFNTAIKARKDAEAKKNAADQPAPGSNQQKNGANGNTAPGKTPANSPSTPGATGNTPVGQNAAVAPGPSLPNPADIGPTKPSELLPPPGDMMPKPQLPQPPSGQPQGAQHPVPQPVKVGSLGGKGDSGVDALMKKAEAQMRDGKFASAIDTYDVAEQSNPRNSLIRLGRTNAELGGSYYRRAALSLRNTLSQDHNLLAGQYDLRGYLGDDRLATIQKDLSDLVQKNPGDTDSAVLLAYVYYNTGNERRAQALLDLADKRANGKDDFIKLLKSSWNFGADDNK